MKFLTLAALASSAVAAPWQIVSKRAIDKDTNCPATLTNGQYENPTPSNSLTTTYMTLQVGLHDVERFEADILVAAFSPNNLATIFSFNIPASRADANCTLEFLFPHREDVIENGQGTFFFKGYNPGSCPNKHTSWNNQPEKGPFPDFPPIRIEPGHAYTIDVGPCFVGAGKCMTWSNDTTLSFKQSSQGCPIGMFTTYEYGLPCPKEYCP